MVKKIFLFFILIITIISCSNDFVVEYQEFGANSLLTNSTKLSDSSAKLIEGIYKTASDNNRIGEQIILKFTNKTLSIFCNKSYDFFILNAGVIDSGIVFEGYGRDLETNNTILARFFIRNEEGALDLLNGKAPQNLILRQELFNSTLTSNQSSPKSENETEYFFEKKLTDKRDFLIVAHRAGGRNSDLLGPSENSLEMIKFTEKLGANAIEIDIRLTKDNIPVLFHDDFISNRLVIGDILLGQIENYTYKHLTSFCTLLNDENIPTLEDALKIVIDSTDIKLVWLDIKSAEVINYTVPIVLKYNEIAKEKGRKVNFAISITSDLVLEKVLNHPDYSKFITICELDKSITKSSGSIMWAPQWTLGFLKNDTEELIQSGIQSVVWTLDDRKFIVEFLENSNFKGILTNYSPIVAYEYYIRN